MEISELVCEQISNFKSNSTRNIEFRIEQLRLLKKVLNDNEELLLEAIYKDLKKSRFNTISTELSLIHGEINCAIKNLKRWSRKKYVTTNLLNLPGRSYLLPEPYGVTLIIGTWNYPYQLTLLPLVSSMAAGNTAIIKPSEIIQNTSKAVADTINQNFPSNYIHVVEGDADVAGELFKQNFDKIFFTPVTLELGGKNPAVILPDCNIEVAAKRIAWGKFANAGQTCVAPDYLLVHSSIEQKLLNELKNILSKTFSNSTVEDNYLAMVNDRHFDRLCNLIDPAKVFYGGVTDKKERFISPTILYNVTFDDEIMRDEIFGPLLPVIRFDNLRDVIEKIQSLGKPLSFYVFGKKSVETDSLFNELSFGGGSLNDTVLYFVNRSLPFGGVGSSGMGSYHGESGFKTFSHYKSILEKKTWPELWFLKVPPFKEWKLSVIRRLIEKNN